MNSFSILVMLLFIEFGYWMTNCHQSVAEILESFFKVKRLPSFGSCPITLDNLNFSQENFVVFI